MIKKNNFFILFLICIKLFFFTLELQHEAKAINIKMPVRVFKGDKFIDSLSIKDFEVIEDGVPGIKREYEDMRLKEARKKNVFQVSRQFVRIIEETS